MSYEFYKVLHILGIALLFTALGGLTLHGINGGSFKDNKHRRLVSITHGVALFLILLAGFGLLARLGLAQDGLPLWILLKLGIWLAMGAVLVVLKRAAQWSRILWFALPLLAACAAYLAISKPV